MLYQILVSLALSIFLINLVLNLKSLKVPRPQTKVPDPAPLVSILIPARDEESNIGSCLESLLKQDYPNFEIVVLDDNSSDGTTGIVARLAAGDKRIRLVSGQALPSEWAGKPFACYQAAEQARGSWLLFVDADTTHHPDMLSSVLPIANESKASMLSGFPRQLTTSLSQKVAVPLMYFIVLSWAPLWLLQRLRKPRPSFAIGQFLLFPADFYWRIGGHAAVKSRIIEDVWLGVETVKHGGRQVTADLSEVVSCHMYNSWQTIWEGIVKWMYSVAAFSMAVLVGLMIVGYMSFLAPFYWLWREVFRSVTPASWGPLIIYQVTVIFLMRWLVGSRFKESPVSVLLHPIGFAFWVAAGLYGMARQVVGRGIYWKRRLYDSTSSIE